MSIQDGFNYTGHFFRKTRKKLHSSQTVYFYTYEHQWLPSFVLDLSKIKKIILLNDDVTPSTMFCTFSHYNYVSHLRSENKSSNISQLPLFVKTSNIATVSRELERCGHQRVGNPGYWF